MEAKIKECKEPQEIIDLVLEYKEAGFNQCNTADSLNVRGFKRHNGKEFKARDISTILLANGVRTLTRVSKDKEEVKQDSELPKLDINFDGFKIGDKVRVTKDYLNRYNQVGIIKEFFTFTSSWTKEEQFCARVSFNVGTDELNLNQLELVKEKVKQESKKNTNQEFKIGDKVRVKTLYLTDVNKIGIIKGIGTTDKNFIVSFDDFNETSFHKYHLELIKEEKQTLMYVYKPNDLVKINNPESKYHNMTGIVLIDNGLRDGSSHNNIYIQLPSESEPVLIPIKDIEINDKNLFGASQASIDFVENQDQKTEFKKADDKLKVGDKVRVSNKGCPEYNQVGIISRFESDVFHNFAIVNIDGQAFNYHQDNLELVEQEPVKEVETNKGFKVGDLVVIDNEYTNFYGSVGTIKDVLSNGRYFVQMKDVNVVAEFIFTSLRKYNPELFKIGSKVKIIDKKNSCFDEIGKINFLNKEITEVIFNDGKSVGTFYLSNLELVDELKEIDNGLVNVDQDLFTPNQNNIVYEKDGKLVTNTLYVSMVFNKEHKSVLRALDLLECTEKFRERNFAPSFYTSEQNKQIRMFEMTEKGFSLLAFSFTGEKAVKFKEKYLDKFEEMSEQLAQTKPVTAIDLFTSQLQALKDQEAKLSLINGRLENVENTLERQEVEKKELLDNLKDVEYSNNTAIEAPLSKKILAVIRKYVVTKFDNPGDKENQEAWYKLDKEIYDRLGFNIPLRKSNYEMRGIKKSRLQIMHELDILNQVFDIVSDIFKV